MKGKRALAILGIFLSLFTMLYVSAEEITYQNVITDDTTIEEDFEILGMEIEDYYIPKSYDYDKWYVIAMSEAYIDKEIQTYFYLYNPAGLIVIPPLRINYSISEGETSKADLTILEYDAEHGYLKANGFRYSYQESCTIAISSILSEYEEDDPINSGEVIKTYREDSSDFKASLTHSLLNESFGIELNFNSTLVIENPTVVKQKINPESSGWNTMDSIVQSSMLWGGEIDTCDLRFYNFNFPDHIQPDSIEYAKFKYDMVNYHKKRNGEIEVLSKSMDIEHEFLPGSYEVKSGLFSSTLEFQTFVLGNRIEKGEFGYIDFSEENIKNFDYDCSILLEVLPIETKYHRHLNNLSIWVTETEQWYSEIDNIQFLELNYKKDDVIYQCKVVSPTIPKEDFEDGGGTAGSRELSWIEKLLIKIADFVLNLFQMNPNLVPTWGKYIIGGAVLIVGFIVALVILIISIPGLGKVIIKGLGILGTGIWFVVSLPFRLIGKLFKRE